MPVYSRSRARAFEGTVRNIEFLAPIAPLVAALGYLALCIDLPLTQWISLVACFALYVLGFGLLATQRAEGRATRIAAGFRQLASDADSERAMASGPRSNVAASICAGLLVLPIEMRRSRLWSILGLGAMVPVLMAVTGFDGWLSGSILASFELGVVAAAIAASALQFHWARSAFRSLRWVFVEGLESSVDVDAGVERVSLARTLRGAAVVPAVLSVLLILNLAAEQHRAAAQAGALAWGEASLSALLDSDSKIPLGERVSRQNKVQTETWPLPVQLSVSLLDRVDDVSARALSNELIAALDVELAKQNRSGSLVVPGAADVAAFRRIDDATIVIAAVDQSHFTPLLLGVNAGIGLFMAGLFAFAWGQGVLVGRDLLASLELLRRAANGWAAGRPLRVAFETGDELGPLGQTLYAVGYELRATTCRVSNALDEVERTASNSMVLASELVVSSAEQSERLQRAMDLVVSIDARGCEVSQSAEALNESVDESSSSIAELGAAGAELNETASILSSKVDEVSKSMEQMVRSVKQVGATTEKLAGASEDTSSSMEEMASAMRSVDTSAESMASLSLDVVAKAEVGQAKVCQTIEGMEAIREATDAAERVIRGLGSRTLEIGGILDVIDDVADETNLLALNAAIIAAQAGEQGKAFSVVADEIKGLADRVLASTKEIGGLIRSVQEESENAIGAIEAGSQSVLSGVDLSAEAGRTLEEITDASRQNGVRIGEIVSSVREQTKAAGHVVGLMERVRDSAEEISTATGEQDRGNEVIYRSALTMREVAQQVRRTTEEQSHGFGRIRESVEGVRSTVEHITGSLREQAGACGEVSTFLQQICEGTCTNDEAFDKLGGAMKELLTQTESLREDVENSQIS